MSSFDLPDKASPFDYSSLTHSFLKYIVSSESLFNFLHNDQTGSAHLSYGTDMSVLLKHLMISLCICLIEISLFCYFRTIFKYIYQPRCFCTPENERMEELPPGFFDWILPTLKYDTSCFLSMGLDTYFFLRFINILLFFFATCGCLNLIILLPVNFTGSTNSFEANGLDKLSISNIAMSKAERLNCHFLCTLMTILYFNILMFYEFRTICKVKHTYLDSFAHRRRASSNVLLMGNVPLKLRSSESLSRFFERSFGKLEHVWFTENYHEYWWQWEQAKEALEILENFYVYQIRAIFKGKSELKETFHPPIYLPLLSIPILNRVVSVRLPGILRTLAFQKPVLLEKWCYDVLSTTSQTIQERLDEIACGTYDKTSKVFLMFVSQESAYAAHQLLLSPTYGELNKSLIAVNREDVIWENLTRDDGNFSIIEKYIIYLVMILLISIYIIPTSLITLLSQVPMITQLLPFMGFLRGLPEEIKVTVSSLLPTIILSLVTAAQLKVFRILLRFKGNWTGAQLERDIQRWYFAFLFIQQFLVVSVSTSLIVVLVQVVERPVSIPILLAANIPKSSIFFFKYLSVKAFSLCGNNFLKINELFMSTCVYRWIDRTPRQMFNRLSTLKKVRWGSNYATLSVYGAIGIIYCTISPIVSIFMIFILLLILLYYKHALHYIYSHLNDSETHGKLYPTALFHLYSGIYCLECCMIGIFVCSKDQNGNCPMKIQTTIMAFALGCTVYGNILAYFDFQKHFNFFPQMNESSASSGELTKETTGLVYETFMYFHPCYNYERPTVWLPRDPLGICDKLTHNITNHMTAVKGASTNGAEILLDGLFPKLRIIHEPPNK